MKVRNKKAKYWLQVKGKGRKENKERWGSQAYAGGPVTTQMCW